MDVHLSPENNNELKKLISSTPNHFNDLLWTTLDSQRKAGLFCDVTIICKNETFPAHRCILAHISPYFKTYFTTCLASSQQVLRFDDFTVEAIATLMNVIYSQVDDVNDSDWLELLRLAEFIQFDWLVEDLVEKIRNSITESNVFDLYCASHSCGVLKVQIIIESYIRENAAKLLHCAHVEHGAEAEALIKRALTCEYANNVVLVAISGIESKELYLIDVHTCYTEEFQVKGELCSFKSIDSTTFIFNNALYEVYDDRSDDGPLERTILHKYQQSTQTSEIVAIFPHNDFIEKLDGINRIIFEQAMFDEFHGLYLYFTTGDNHLHFIFKIDLESLDIHLGHLTITMATNEKSYLHDTTLVNFQNVYNFHNFDFDLHSNHIQVAHDIAGVKDNALRLKLTDAACMGVCKMVGLSGHTYCVFQKYGEPRVISVLRLDLYTRMWIELCRYTSTSELRYMEESDIFVSHSTLFISPMSSGAETRHLLYFDLNSLKVKDSNITLPSNGVSVMYFMTIPLHILI